MSIQEDEMWESDSRCHPVVRRMALYYLSSLISPGDTQMQQLVEGRCWRGLAEDTGAGFCFFFRNSSLRLAFLLMVDGLGFFLERALAWVSRAGTPVSRVKEKLEPTMRENLNPELWLLSVWQKSRHLVAKSVSPIAVIFEYF